MLVLIIAVTLFFFLFNLRLVKGDFFEPSVIFSVSFLVQALLSLFALTYLHLKFHSEIVLLLLVSELIFLLFTIFFTSNGNRIYGQQKIENLSSDVDVLKISSWITFVVVVLMVYAIILRRQYLIDFSRAFGMPNSTFSEKIALYDKIVKFDPNRYRSVGLYPSRIYNLLSTVTYAYAYLTGYVVANNFGLKKLPKWIDLIVLILFSYLSYLGGGRSGLFRLATFMLLVFYVVSRKQEGKFFLNFKLFKRLFLGAVVAIILFLASISLFGRTSNYNPLHYLYIYLGAPLYNLDVFIQNHTLPIEQPYWGQQTFNNLYKFIWPRVGLETIPMNLPFVRYNWQYGLGNVYTTYYQFLYDFGFLGVVPLISFIAYYYTGFYHRIKVRPLAAKRIDFRLFIYAYLFNDLIMLIFSNRFYETFLNFGTLRFFILSYVISSLIFERSVRIGKIKIRLL